MENIIQSFSLNGKRSLVTGASKGIGASTAQILAEAGSDVVITGRDLEGLKETQENIESHNEMLSHRSRSFSGK